MPTMLAKPPSLPRDRESIETPLLVSAGVALGIFVATRMSSGALPAFTCALKKFTGIPCPACGGTRCLAACGRLDLASAFSWNPLVAIGAITLLSWSALALATPAAASRMTAFFTARKVAALAGANWLYLCWALPR